MKAIVGLVGMPLAGKETVSAKLARYAHEAGATAHHVRFRDILAETLELWHIPCNRENLQKLAQIMVEPDAFGPRALTAAVKTRLMKDSADLIIVDGVRWPTDEAMLRDMPDGKGILLYVDADADTRFSRAKRRQREGEEELTRNAFDVQDAAPNESSVDAIGSRADWRIPNGRDTNEAALELRIKAFFDGCIAPLLAA